MSIEYGLEYARAKKDLDDSICEGGKHVILINKRSAVCILAHLDALDGVDAEPGPGYVNQDGPEHNTVNIVVVDSEERKEVKRLVEMNMTHPAYLQGEMNSVGSLFERISKLL